MTEKGYTRDRKWVLVHYVFDLRFLSVNNIYLIERFHHISIFGAYHTYFGLSVYPFQMPNASVYFQDTNPLPVVDLLQYVLSSTREVGACLASACIIIKTGAQQDFMSF